MDFLQGLNPQQQEAAAHVDGPLLILAGAGSGKTRVITHRIAHLVTAHGVPAYKVLAVTFTNKAAGEMRQRITSLLAKAGSSGTPVVSTFHSFCVRLLRREGDSLSAIRPGFTRNFTIYDDDEQVSIIKSIYKTLGLDEKFMPYRGALSRISTGKNHQETPQDFYTNSTDPKNSRLAVIYEKYEETLKKANALDFDDLLLETVRLLKHDADVRQRNNERISYMMIDEYQDTNRTQYELMRLLTVVNPNIAVVGDEDQSIYGWRGADIRNILDFEKDYPNAKVIRLEQNYRSTKNILESASAVVANNKNRKGKWLWTDSGSGEKITLYEAMDGENEALFIADTIDKVLRDFPKEKVAVLYRTNFQSRQIEEALRRYNRKYTVVGGLSFYQRAEIKDVLAYLKVIHQPQDSISILRVINVPARGIGKTTVEQIEQYALTHELSIWSAIGQMLDEQVFPARAATSLKVFQRIIEELREELPDKRLDEILNLILDRTGYLRMLESDQTPESESRQGNLAELVNAAAEASERGEGVTEFLDHAALVAQTDDIDDAAVISLLTMHNAKGLEFPVVFIAGMEEGLFPHSRSVTSGVEDQMEEERRLCYVGMTRAEKKLYLSWARYRRRFGGGQPEPCIPSRFLKEVPPALLDRKGAANDMPQVELYAERSYVRETAKKNLYTGKTYNSLDNIAQYFAERGIAAPRPPAPTKPAPAATPATPAASPKPLLGSAGYMQPKPPQQQVQRSMFGAPPAPAKQKKFGAGSVVNHPKYGRGTVMRMEGEGDDAKLTISFPGYGLKKIIQKYAGIQKDE